MWLRRTAKILLISTRSLSGSAIDRTSFLCLRTKNAFCSEVFILWLGFYAAHLISRPLSAEIISSDFATVPRRLKLESTISCAGVHFFVESAALETSRPVVNQSTCHWH